MSRCFAKDTFAPVRNLVCSHAGVPSNEVWLDENSSSGKVFAKGLPEYKALDTDTDVFYRQGFFFREGGDRQLWIRVRGLELKPNRYWVFICEAIEVVDDEGNVLSTLDHVVSHAREEVILYEADKEPGLNVRLFVEGEPLLLIAAANPSEAYGKLKQMDNLACIVAKTADYHDYLEDFFLPDKEAKLNLDALRGVVLNTFIQLYLSEDDQAKIERYKLLSKCAHDQLPSMFHTMYALEDVDF